MLLMLLQIPFAPEQGSSFAQEVDMLYLYLIAITVFFTLAISLLLLYFAIRYRRRSRLEVPRPVAGSIKLETLWTVIPLLISFTIFGWGASVYFKLYNPPAATIDVYVVGKQWMWKFQHAGGQREINELHIPVGSRVKLTMTTEDVIHSLYVPAFRTKMDVVPGRYTYMWFEPTKAGRYHLFCAEYCGTNHSGMIGSIVVMEPTEYQAWLSGGATDSPASQGAKLFQDLGCVTCHRDDTQGRGPVLTGLFGKPVDLDNGQRVTADEAYIRESIVNPRAKTVAGFQQLMPTYQGQLSEEQLLYLIAYIRSLGTPAGTGTTGATTGSGAATTTGGPAPDSMRSNPLAPSQPGANSSSGRPSAAPAGTAPTRAPGSNQARNNNRQ